MLNVLIVDDEQIIREGISNSINWSEMGLNLAGTAQNGGVAFERIKNENIDIAIIDIKMPVMNGIELVERTRNEKIDTEFIILSGYDDFEYAKVAMENGVRYFLLKPTDPEEIEEALQGSIRRINLKEKSRSIENKYYENTKKLMELMKEQFLRDCILGRIYNKEEKEYYIETFNMQHKSFSAIAVRGDMADCEGGAFYLRSAIEDLLKEQLILCTAIRDIVFMVIDYSERPTLLEKDKSLVSELKNLGFTSVTSTIYSEWTMENASSIAREMEGCIRFRFWLPEAEIILKEDTTIGNSSRFEYRSDNLINYIQIGDKVNSENELNVFFSILTENKSSIEMCKFQSVRLYMDLLEKYNRFRENCMDDTMSIQTFETFSDIKNFMYDFVMKLCDESHEKMNTKNNKQIARVVECIEENISNEDLSLKWLSNNLVYFNSDYLGKLFKKEIGMSFTNYVMKRRIEKACELFKNNPESHIYNVAEATGFGDNTQYFSQVFKKIMGILPSDYQKSL